MDEYKRLVTTGRAFGIEAHLITPEEVQKLMPIIDKNVIVGGMYTPGDGSVDPAMWMSALTRSAKSNGAQVLIVLAYIL